MPFGILVGIIFISSLYLISTRQKSIYKPETASARRIYREACLQCHGEQGEGSGIFYPGFDDLISKEQIKDKIVNGGILMPAFIHIQGDTLENLILYIHQREYLPAMNP